MKTTNKDGGLDIFKQRLADVLTDVMKYVATAVLISTIFTGLGGNYVIGGGILFMAVALIGLYLLTKNKQ